MSRFIRRIAFPRNAYGMTCLRRVWILMTTRRFKKWVLTLAVCTTILGSASAMERWSFPDFRQDDKKEHAAAGAAIATVTDFALREFEPQWPTWKRVLADLAVSTAAGVLKEVNDGRRGRKHDTCDPADAIATSLGGCAAAVSVTAIWRF